MPVAGAAAAGKTEDVLALEGKDKEVYERFVRAGCAHMFDHAGDHERKRKGGKAATKSLRDNRLERNETCVAAHEARHRDAAAATAEVESVARGAAAEKKQLLTAVAGVPAVSEATSAYLCED